MLRMTLEIYENLVSSKKSCVNLGKYDGQLALNIVLVLNIACMARKFLFSLLSIHAIFEQYTLARN